MSSENRSKPPRMSVDEIMAAIGNPNGSLHQPEGDPNAQALGRLGPIALDRLEASPTNVTAPQGAGSAGYLTPGAKGTADDGTVNVGGNRPDSSTGPQQLPVISGLGALTAGGSFGANRPSGSPAQPAMPAPEAGGPQLTSQGINPALKAALAPRPGPFGDPSVGK